MTRRIRTTKTAADPTPPRKGPSKVIVAGPPPMPVGPPPGRLTVVEQVSFQRAGDRPVTAASAYHFKTSAAPAVQQRIVVGPTWARLVPAGSAEVSAVHLSNDEGKGRTLIPTPEEVAETEAKVVEVAYSSSDDGDCFLVRPGRTFRAEPNGVGASNLVVRCRSGEAQCTLTLFPA